MIKNYKIVLQYDGSRYDGWQKQGNTGNTLQGKLEGILLKLTGRPVEVHGSGRTDAGVHALAQTANFHADTGMTEDQIRAYFNQYLPEDIAVLSVETVPDKFHSRLNAVKKTYLYRIEMGPKKDVFERKYCYGLGIHTFGQLVVVLPQLPADGGSGGLCSGGTRFQELLRQQKDEKVHSEDDFGYHI